MVSGGRTKILSARVYLLNHDAKGTRYDLCFFRLYWIVSFLFQRSLAVLFLLLLVSFSVAYT